MECNQFMNAGHTDEYCYQKKRQENWNLFEDKEEVADPPEREFSFFNADLKEIENQQLFANESGSNKKTVKDIDLIFFLDGSLSAEYQCTRNSFSKNRNY